MTYVFFSFADRWFVVTHSFTDVHSSFGHFWNVFKKGTDFSYNLFYRFLRFIDNWIQVEANPNQELNKLSEKNVFFAIMNVVNIKWIRNIIFLRNRWIVHIDLLEIFCLVFVINVFVVDDRVRYLLYNLEKVSDFRIIFIKTAIQSGQTKMT